MIDFMFFVQLHLTVFLLKISCSLNCHGKCLSNNFKKWWPTFVTTFLLYGAFNHIMFLFLFCLALFSCLDCTYIQQKVVTKVGQHFFKLLEKHFPRQLKLQEIFYKNTVKVRYSCTESVIKMFYIKVNYVQTNESVTA